MMATLRAEFKKLLTVRSTYVISALILILSGIFAYSNTAPVYEVESQQRQQAAPSERAQTEEAAPENPPKLITTLPPNHLSNSLLELMSGSVLLMGVVVILIMSHEYRFNTIYYSLTQSNRRSKVLAAKAAVASVYTLVIAALAALVTIAVVYIAADIKNLTLPAQEINVLYVLGRDVFFVLGYSLLALALITLLRHLAVALVIFFMLPVISNLIGVLLKIENQAGIMPMASLERVVHDQPGVSLGKAMAVYLAYFVALWAVTWYLFIRRDAN